MKSKLAIFLIFAGSLLLGYAPMASAESVRVKPLQYQVNLEKGEKKKGFVDVTNPANESVEVKLYVNAFSQEDDKGNLKFFPNEQVTKGLLLDYNVATIGPRQTLRLYFLADGTKLPTGDVFGVIFAETQPVSRPGVNTAVRVGTLVMITNQTPGPRHAEIASFQVPLISVGDSLDGEVTVKNPAPKGSATGFFPEISVEAFPWGSMMKSKGPLIFAGNQRTAEFQLPSNQFGFYVIKVKANDAEVSKLVFLMTGWWRLVAPILLLTIGGVGYLTWRYRLYRKLPFVRKRPL